MRSSVVLTLSLLVAPRVTFTSAWQEIHSDVGVRIKLDNDDPEQDQKAFFAYIKAKFPSAKIDLSVQAHVQEVVERAVGRKLYTGSAVNNGAGFMDAEKQTLLDLHNSYRSATAEGETPGQESATFMNELFWDEALAQVAQDYAERCIWAHNTDPVGDFRQVANSVEPTFGYGDDMKIGENLYAWDSYTSITSGATTLSAFVQSGVRGWYDEYPGYSLSDNSCDLSKISQSTCGHYTQLVWAETRYVGCGAALCPDMTNLENQGYTNSIILACNYYNAGNWAGAKPYTSGTSCSMCPSDRNKCEDGLCTGCPAMYYTYCQDSAPNCALNICPARCSLDSTSDACTLCRDTCNTCTADMTAPICTCTNGFVSYVGDGDATCVSDASNIGSDGTCSHFALAATMSSLAAATLV